MGCLFSGRDRYFDDNFLVLTRHVKSGFLFNSLYITPREGDFDDIIVHIYHFFRLTLFPFFSLPCYNVISLFFVFKSYFLVLCLIIIWF